MSKIKFEKGLLFRLRAKISAVKCVLSGKPLIYGTSNLNIAIRGDAHGLKFIGNNNTRIDYIGITCCKCDNLADAKVSHMKKKSVTYYCYEHLHEDYGSKDAFIIIPSDTYIEGINNNIPEFLKMINKEKGK